MKLGNINSFNSFSQSRSILYKQIAQDNLKSHLYTPKILQITSDRMSLQMSYILISDYHNSFFKKKMDIGLNLLLKLKYIDQSVPGGKWVQLYLFPLATLPSLRIHTRPPPAACPYCSNVLLAGSWLSWLVSLPLNNAFEMWQGAEMLSKSKVDELYLCIII